MTIAPADDMPDPVPGDDESEAEEAPIFASDLAPERRVRNQRLAAFVIFVLVFVLVTVFGLAVFVHYAATHHTFLDAQ